MSAKPHVPVEAPDSLVSASYAKIVDFLSEGEIDGLVDGYKSIYVNDTPLQNTDGSFNFQGITVETRNGTQGQAYISGFDESANEIPVGITVQQATPIVRTITNLTVNAVRPIITVPQLQEFCDNGDIGGASFRVVIYVQYNGGSYTQVINDVVIGRASQQYQRQYLINLSGAFPVNIKVERNNPDSTSSKIIDAFSFSSYSEVTWGKLAYPGSALVGLRINAEQFASIPDRSYLIRGLKIKIPNNATVERATGRLIYSGIWDGTFSATAQWCSDPAWCLWDLCTARYAFGDQIDSSLLDRWAFYSASQYCSELVDSGFRADSGSIIYEPRFSCNVNIQNSEDAYGLINSMASVFRGMPFWSTGALTVSQDRPQDPAYLFNLSNVSEPGFQYSGSSVKTRPTVVIVKYFDLDIRNYAWEPVEDQAGIAKYGVIKAEIEAYACTSRGQAHRWGQWYLAAEQEVCTFTTSVAEGVILRPGQVVEICDPMRAGARRGGRISAATASAITVDDATGLVASNTPMLSVILPDGTAQARPVAGITGNVISVSTAFSAAPNSNSIWNFETSTLQSTTWRVLSVMEQDQCQYAITCLGYDASKYANIENGTPLQPRTVTILNDIPAAPTSLSITEALYSYQAQIRSKVIVSWKGVQGISQYLIKWRSTSGSQPGNWTQITRQQQDYEILDITPGYFEINVYSVNSGGQSSATPLSGSITALGKVAPPSNVTGFTATLDPSAGVTLSWDPVADLDLQGYEIWQGPGWGSGTKLGLFSATSKKLAMPAASSTTWWIKALDTSDSYSTTAASAVLTVGGAAAPTTSGSFAGENFTLNWGAVNGSLTTAVYEVRYGTSSSTWATATSLGTVKGTTFTTKAAWAGVRRFFVAAVDIIGTVGTSNYFDAIVVAPTQPTIAAQVIDNNVLLQWNDCTQTLPIASYELRKGTTWTTATVIGSKQGRFTSVFEVVSGSFTYWLAGTDSSGNYGTPGSITTTVNQPPDYVLKLNFNSTFSGSKTNAVMDGAALVACINTSETWQSHFTSRSWSTPQDQINAGFTYFAMPSQTTGQYYDDIDYGTVLVGSKVTMTLTSSSIAGATTITPTISTKKLSTDAWTVYAGLSSVFATDFRYVRAQYDFASAGGDDLLQITGLNVKLDSKLRNDSGTGTAVSTDSGGTVVSFNVAFIDIDSISVTPLATTSVVAVYDFVDAPNPTSFKVLLFNSSGTRISGAFSWSARGV